jgi:pantoate--beta-alanine ligase
VEQITDPAAVRAWSRAAGGRVGFVPTMGFLHEGHLRLVDLAAARADVVVMSIFVNPLQFAPGEDFERYPRDLARDSALAKSRGVACLFAPAARDVYPRGEALVRVTPTTLAAHLCGPFRPGHFEGVLTVVAKLFHLVEPDVAVFGRKDAQQAAMVRRMVTDLDLPVEIVVAPTVRELDGLALSSRNQYLSTAERASAVALSRGLEAGHTAFRGGERDPAAIIRAAEAVVGREPALRVEYIEAVHPDTLAPVSAASDDTLLAIAARIGKTRLIDNVILGRGLAGDDRIGRVAG